MDDNQNNGDQHQPNADQTDELDAIKRETVAALAPLVHELDTDPERKFELCMVALRNGQDTSLLRTALDAARAIDDKQTKAEYLLEIIDEINYRQQQSS